MTGPTDVTVPALTDGEWPVRTERLLLRPATLADLEVVWTAWRHREDVGEWMSEPAPPLADYLRFVGAPDRLPTVLVAELDGQVVMDLHVRIRDSYSQSAVAEQAARTKGNLGWSMDPTVHGRGLATEALGAVVALCFDRLGLHRIEAHCFAANEASWRLMERVGMRREGHFVEEAMHRRLGWTDMFAYGLTASQWRSHDEAAGEQTDHE